MLKPPEARKGSHYAHGCWLLCTIGTTRNPAIQVDVPPPVITKADTVFHKSLGKIPLVTTYTASDKITSEPQGQGH